VEKPKNSRHRELDKGGKHQLRGKLDEADRGGKVGGEERGGGIGLLGGKNWVRAAEIEATEDENRFRKKKGGRGKKKRDGQVGEGKRGRREGKGSVNPKTPRETKIPHKKGGPSWEEKKGEKKVGCAGKGLISNRGGLTCFLEVNILRTHAAKNNHRGVKKGKRKSPFFKRRDLTQLEDKTNAPMKKKKGRVEGM